MGYTRCSEEHRNHGEVREPLPSPARCVSEYSQSAHRKKHARSIFGSSVSHFTPSNLHWPFHHRRTSDAQSTSATSHFSAFSHVKDFSHFRDFGKDLGRAGDHNSSWTRPQTSDAASLMSRSLVPDYVVNYIRGETPESLAKKREQMRWNRRDVMITPQRERFMSQQAFFEDPFSSRTFLTLNPYDSRGQESRRLFDGWRGGVTAHATLSFIIMVVAVVCVGVLAAKNSMTAGEAAMFSGSCTTASNVNTALHVVINIFTMIILAGGNYVFQVLSSPTRTEVATAHDKKQWLDIGIPSIRNFLRISRLRSALATVLILAAVATHVM